MSSPYGSGCRCPCLGEGTPEHAPGPLCLPDWVDPWGDQDWARPAPGEPTDGGCE